MGAVAMRSLCGCCGRWGSARQTTSRFDGTADCRCASGHDGGVKKQRIAAQVSLDHANNLHWTVMIETVMLGDG